MTAARKKTAPTVGEKTQEAALLSLERLIELLRNPDTPNADVLKASALIFERIYPLQCSGAAAQGDFDIVLDENPGAALGPKGRESGAQEANLRSMDAPKTRPCEQTQEG